MTQFISDVPTFAPSTHRRSNYHLAFVDHEQRNMYVQYTNLSKHPLKSTLKLFSKSVSNVFPMRLDPGKPWKNPCQSCHGFQEAMKPTWGQTRHDSTKLKGDIIGADHPLQPRADDGSCCQSSSPVCFCQPHGVNIGYYMDTKFIKPHIFTGDNRIQFMDISWRSEISNKMILAL